MDFFLCLLTKRLLFRLNNFSLLLNEQQKQPVNTQQKQNHDKQIKQQVIDFEKKNLSSYLSCLNLVQISGNDKEIKYEINILHASFRSK